MCLPCVLMHVSCAHMSPRGPVCQGVYMGVVAGNPLFCCPPAVFVSRRTITVEDLYIMGQHVCWPASVSSPVAARWCVLCGSISVGFFPTSWPAMVPSNVSFLSVRDFLLLPSGSPGLACSPQCLRLAFV
jgi:hypothetical protein